MTVNNHIPPSHVADFITFLLHFITSKYAINLVRVINCGFNTPLPILGGVSISRCFSQAIPLKSPIRK